MEDKKITVIMGIYNCESTLDEAIESILQQSYKNWNMIMCDDGSVDNTYAVAMKYCIEYPKKIKLIKNEKNMGLNYTLNRCLECSDGHFIARMDGDDISTPNRFEEEVAVLINNVDIAFVSTPMIFFDESGEWGKGTAINRPVKEDLAKGQPFCHAPCLIRKEVFDAIGGYSEDKRLLRVEDQHLYLKIYKKGYLGLNLLEPLYKMRDDRNAYNRRKFKYRINEAYVKYLNVKELKLPLYYLIYALRPILVGMLPKSIYDAFHKRRLSNIDNYKGKVNTNFRR